MRAGPLLGAFAVAVALAACAPDAPEPEPEQTAIPEAPADVVLVAAWSHDGTKLAVAWTRRDRSRIYGLLAPFDDTPPEPSRGLPLTEGEGTSPAWSPDGLWLAFATNRTGNGEIYRVRPDGTGPENLTNDPAEDGEPVYAPDGRRIAFVSDRGGGGETRVWTMDADGGGARPLGDTPPGAEHAPAWAPDGRRLALAVGRGATRAIWVAAADGRGAEQVAAGGAPSWSRDGATLYYERADSVFARTPVAAGGEERLLVEGRMPRPSPDGRWLAYVRGDPPSAALYLLDLERATETRITP